MTTEVKTPRRGPIPLADKLAQLRNDKQRVLDKMRARELKIDGELTRLRRAIAAGEEELQRMRLALGDVDTTTVSGPGLYQSLGRANGTLAPQSVETPAHEVLVTPHGQLVAEVRSEIGIAEDNTAFEVKTINGAAE